MTPIEALRAMLDEPMFGTQKERVVAALEYVPVLLAAARAEADRIATDEAWAAALGATGPDLKGAHSPASRAGVVERAFARLREEQREADATVAASWAREACLARGEPGNLFDAIMATPLTSEPLKARIAELERALADAVAIAREFDARQQKAEARVAELEREARELTQENVRLDDLARNCREGAKRIEKELAHWRSRAIDADARLREVQDELAHEKGGRLDEAAIRAACERETGVWPYGRIADAIVETLRTQQVKWEAFVTAESERAEKAEARVAELEKGLADAVAIAREFDARGQEAVAALRGLRATIRVEPTMDGAYRNPAFNYPRSDAADWCKRSDAVLANLAKYPEGR